MKLSWKEYDTQIRCRVTQGAEIMGYLVIDSTIGNRSGGGLRMLPDIDELEIRSLARAMTLKYGFLGLPQGGAKAGVYGDPKAPESARIQTLTKFGQAISPLIQKRIYYPSADMGTDNTIIRKMLCSIGIKVRYRELRGTRSGYYTAHSVMAGAVQATRFLGLNLHESTAAIEGFGKVGAPLASLLAKAGMRVVAISTSRGAIMAPDGLNVERLLQIKKEKADHVLEFYDSAKRIDKEALLKLPVTLLSPCARHNTIHKDNAESIKARILCPGANNPITPEAEKILFKKGILCLPDFVTNSGGVLGGTMEFALVKPKRIESFITQLLGARIKNLLKEAEDKDILPREIAIPLSLNRFHKMKQEASYPTPISRIFGFALELYRRGVVPGNIVSFLAPSFFAKRLQL